MKKFESILLFSFLLFLSCFLTTSAAADSPMYRLYNPNSGEHFYTASSYERDSLGSVGWRKEGVGWLAPYTGSPVYRLYNPNSGDHHYTLSAGERDVLRNVGWRYEGIAWQSGGSVPVYRLYNPNARTGTHHYTLWAGERDSLSRIGWRYEGISWNALNDGAAYADASSYSSTPSNNSGAGKALVTGNPDGLVFVASGGNSDVYWYRLENMPSNTNLRNVVKMSEQTAISQGKHHSEKEKYQ